MKPITEIKNDMHLKFEQNQNNNRTEVSANKPKMLEREYITETQVIEDRTIQIIYSISAIYSENI